MTVFSWKGVTSDFNINDLFERIVIDVVSVKNEGNCISQQTRITRNIRRSIINKRIRDLFQISQIRNSELVSVIIDFQRLFQFSLYCSLKHKKNCMIPTNVLLGIRTIKNSQLSSCVRKELIEPDHFWFYDSTKSIPNDQVHCAI